jgi:hypothetical protein
MTSRFVCWSLASANGTPWYECTPGQPHHTSAGHRNGPSTLCGTQHWGWRLHVDMSATATQCVALLTRRERPSQVAARAFTNITCRINHANNVTQPTRVQRCARAKDNRGKVLALPTPQLEKPSAISPASLSDATQLGHPGPLIHRALRSHPETHSCLYGTNSSQHSRPIPSGARRCSGMFQQLHDCGVHPPG